MQSTDNKVYSYHKGSGFVIRSNNDAIWKIEEQIGESVVYNTDPTSALTSKTKKHIAMLRLQQKFETRTVFQIYPSDPIPPRLYGVTKGHKPKKCYSMPATILTIGTPPYSVSQYLVELIQPTLNKSKYEIKNSTLFVNKAKRNKVQSYYDIVNLYSSVPINKALDILAD